MEEELNENELEERMYAMLHYADDTEAIVYNKEDLAQIVESAPRPTLRRYWRTSGDLEVSPYSKVNTPKESQANVIATDTKSRDEKRDAPAPQPAVDLSIFQSIPKNIKQSVEILVNDDERIVELVSSDEDEVIEVALPPKPTITIDSSDEEETRVKKQASLKENAKQSKNKTNTDRDVSASPVPSVVSSVSDEFIRGDCIALNISSRHPDNHSFDFSLHGSDFIDPNTPTKKRKKKKSKDHATSTPVAVESRKDMSVMNSNDGYFATPKSKAKNKKQKNSYVVSEKSVPNADVYDSDSNQSVIDTNKTDGCFAVTEKSLPSADVYDSDSSQSEIIKNNKTLQTKLVITNCTDSSDSSVSLDKPDNEHWNTLKQKDSNNEINKTSIVDLTDDKVTEVDSIDENIMMGNVSGFLEVDDYEDEEPKSQNAISNFVSTKIPAILNEDLDFDNLKGKDSVCRKRRYSLTTLRAEMEKFYNESWGGENFNHQAILANMSCDAKLWAIDPKDKTPNVNRRKTCHYCNRPGHRDDNCRNKPLVCYMCGSYGHIETRCPRKICVNCGSPNYIYSAICRNCSHWRNIICNECGQNGHPSSHCPDLWRRYHNTINENNPLEEIHYTKSKQHLYCSGCTRRGHLVHTCRQFLPFSTLPINSPFVSVYRPLYFTEKPGKPFFVDQVNNQRNKYSYQHFSQDVTMSPESHFKPNRCKRQSKSPSGHENHFNKKRTISISEIADEQQHTKSPNSFVHQRKNSQHKEVEDTNNVKNTSELSNHIQINNVTDFCPNSSTNRDRKEQVIQDNEVSDTSNVVTSARICVTKGIIENLKSKEGEEWLKQAMAEHDITVQYTDVNSFINISGKFGDQEAFQLDLREWTKKLVKQRYDDKFDISQESNNKFTGVIPKKPHKTLHKLNTAFESLKSYLGEPRAIYKELTYLQNHHETLLKEKVVSPKRLANNRVIIKKMLKRLNMVLLGQAGLADGPKHLNELYALQNIVAKTKDKIIAPDIRKAIEEHYNFIFTAMRRNDYEELLNKYYTSKQSPTVLKDAINNSANSAINVQKKNINNISLSKNVQKDLIINNKGSGDIIHFKSLNKRKPLPEKTMKKLVFYHKRLLQARPIDAVLKKTRVELVRKLHSHIASLGRNANTTSKALKKMRRIQQQAKLFLTHNL